MLSFAASRPPSLRRVRHCQPSAQPRPITSTPQTKVECDGGLLLMTKNIYVLKPLNTRAPWEPPKVLAT